MSMLRRPYTLDMCTSLSSTPSTPSMTLRATKGSDQGHSEDRAS